VGHAPQPRSKSDAEAAQRRSVPVSELPPGQRSWWLVVDPNADVDLCSIDPGFDVDLYVSTDLRTMTGFGWAWTLCGRRCAPNA